MDIPFGYIEDNVLYRAAFGDVEVLKLAEVTDNQLEKQVVALEEKFVRLKNKLDTVIEKINNSDNKGSFLSALLNIKDVVPTHQGLGDYQSMLGEIYQYESLLNDYIKKNREKNTEIKKALLVELDHILLNNDIQEAFELVKDLKRRWIKTGGADESLKEKMESEFQEGVNKFFEKRNSFLEAKKTLRQARIEDYQSIIDRIKECIEHADILKTQGEIKSLQKQWKEAGRIQEEDFKRLNGAYWDITKKYFDKLKAYRSEERKNRSKNEREIIDERRGIISTMQSLLDESATEDVKKELDRLSALWKRAGHLSKSKFQDVQDNYYDVLRIIQEKQFILGLTQKKNKDFTKKTEREKFSLLIKTLRNVLRRDEEELTSFSENMDKMTINKGSFVEMLESKLFDRQKKVALKKNLLEEYQLKIKK